MLLPPLGALHLEPAIAYFQDMRDRQRFESLRKLAPREAVQAWLNGEFGIDDEPALIEALRRDPRVIGSDDQIIDTFCNAMVEGWDAQRTFERLTHSV